MARDFQFLIFRDEAPLREVGFFSQSPLTLDIRGSGFVGVSRVLVNHVPSPEFIVLSRTRLLAQVPSSQQDSPLTSLSVQLSRSGLTPSASIDFDVSVPGGSATGFIKLLQAFLRVLFTNQGEDLANPWLGGGLYSLVGSAGSPATLRSVAAQSISLAESQLVRLQATNPGLASSERLRSATLLSASYDQATTTVRLKITLTAMDGTTGTPTVSV